MTLAVAATTRLSSLPCPNPPLAYRTAVHIPKYVGSEGQQEPVEYTLRPFLKIAREHTQSECCTRTCAHSHSPSLSLAPLGFETQTWQKVRPSLLTRAAAATA